MSNVDISLLHKPNNMKLELTTRQSVLLIEGVISRINIVEKLIPNLTTMILVAEYIKERDELLELKDILINNHTAFRSVSPMEQLTNF